MSHDKLITTRTLKEQFKALIVKLLAVYDVEVSTSTESDEEIDLIVTRDKTVHAAIEIKLYRTKKVSLSTLENAMTHLMNIGTKANVSHLILVVSCIISDEWYELAKRKYGIILWDQNDLVQLAVQSGKGFQGLQDFFNGLVTKSDNTEPSNGLITHRHVVIDDLWSVNPRAIRLKQSKGNELYANLMHDPRGQAKWTKFENSVFDIMKYLFKKDLSGWYKNLKAEAGYNRFELVCRINSKHDFWHRVADEFNTRYIFFECKEYKEIFTYKNVLNQEINILAQAFRAIGFIISKRDPVNYPDMYSQGAFYENGKLLIHLTEEDLYRLLTDKDIGNDVTSLLREKLDEAILNITL